MTKPHHNLGRKYNVRERDTNYAASKRAEEGWRAQLGTIPIASTLNQALLGDPLPGRGFLDRIKDTS